MNTLHFLMLLTVLYATLLPLAQAECSRLQDKGKGAHGEKVCKPNYPLIVGAAIGCITAVSIVFVLLRALYRACRKARRTGKTTRAARVITRGSAHMV